MEADTFASGQEIIDRVESTPSFRPDCLVVDVQMPGISGLDLQERLAAGPAQFPMIFITAHHEFGVRERAMARGAVAFLQKPFDDVLFINTLRAAIERDAVTKD